jgi:hypothetical protein
MATMWVMATVTWVVGNEEGNGGDAKSNGNGNESGVQATATRAMVRVMPTTWAMATRGTISLMKTASTKVC